MMQKANSELNIHVGIGATRNFPVELEADEFYLNSGFPARIRGRFLNATVEQLLRFESRRGVNVGLRGARYDFVKFEEDGRFTLHRHSEKRTAIF